MIFELGHKTMENICCAEGEDAVNHYTVNRWFKKLGSGWKKFANQVIFKTIDSEAMLKANLLSSNWRI